MSDTTLAANHRAMLEASGLDVEVIAERGYFTATTKQQLAEIGFPPTQRLVPTLVVPIYDVKGDLANYQHRPDRPRLNKASKTIKYETRAGSQLVIDVPVRARLWLRDRERPLFITEGSKKADAAVSRGLCCVALLGVWNWRDSDGVLPDWEYIGLKDRKVYVVFDSDVMEKEAVHQALVRVKAVLEHRQATVRVIYLPTGDGGEKVGLDDYFSGGHSVDDLLSHATSEIRRPDSYVEPEPLRTFQTRSLEDVVQTFRQYLHLPNADSLLAVLGAYAANQLPGPPVWLLLVGPPSGGKTEQILPLSALPDVHVASVLTEGALLSGVPGKDHAAGAKGGLLREIGDFGYLVLKDFTSVLAMNKESRGTVLAALREVYDGEWTRHVGTDGGKALHWEGKVGLIAGCTPALDSHHAVMASLGERFLLFRLPEVHEDKVTEMSLDHGDAAQHAALAEAVGGLLTNLRETPPIERLTAPGERPFLINLAKLAVRGRSPVDRDYGASRDILNVPEPEAPPRLAQALQRLFTGLLAIGASREDGWRIIRHVAMSSMPAVRRKAIEALDGERWVKTSAASLRIGVPSSTAQRTLEDLYVLGVMERRASGDGEPGAGRAYEWKLADWAGATIESPLPETSSLILVVKDMGNVIEGDVDERVVDRAVFTPPELGKRFPMKCDGVTCGQFWYDSEKRPRCGNHDPQPQAVQ